MSGKTLRSLTDLMSAGLSPAGVDEKLRAVAARYSVAVTPDVAALIDRDDPADPIARQFLPDARELMTLPQELADPIGDDAHSPVPGVVHRYPDRVLLKLLTICPVYCRFCFRRETVGAGKGDLLGEPEVQAALDYIAATPKIFEVILTGGDPLMLSARRLASVALVALRQSSTSKSCASTAAPRRRRPSSSRPNGWRRYGKAARRCIWRCTSITRANSRPPPAPPSPGCAGRA